jgi:outer membrane protein assembly factor BamB
MGETGFPLARSAAVYVENPIRGIAVAETWMAVDTLEHIEGLDLESQKELWSLALATPRFAGSFLTLGDTLIVASPEQVLLLDRSGGRQVLNMATHKPSIIRLVAAYPGYLYLIQGPKWTLEAYSLAENRLLWQVVVGRGGADEVFYDPSNNIVYVTGGSVQALDNTSGTVLWKQSRNTLVATFEGGILYAYERLNGASQYQVTALDVADQSEVWTRGFYSGDSEGVNAVKVVGDMLLLCGRDLIALDKGGGKERWTVSVGETFYTCPVQFHGTLYEMNGTSQTVFAVSPQDGAVIGHVRLEEQTVLQGADADAAVHVLRNGILFNTRHTIAIYRDR